MTINLHIDLYIYSTTSKTHLINIFVYENRFLLIITEISFINNKFCQLTTVHTEIMTPTAKFVVLVHITQTILY